jgi:phenylacetate-CoA ligase
MAPDLHVILSQTIKAVFLNSEFPHPHFRNTIEAVFGAITLSWYGHTERCVLAHEKKERFLYFPMQSYGWVEGLTDTNGKSQLIGSSYYNFSSPFIRYNTGDLIENCHFGKAGILRTFTINDGRSGEFILDKNHNRIPLTGLIFGRHHVLFDFTSFVQVKQLKPGFAIILYVCRAGKKLPWNRLVCDLFDCTNVNIEFDFQEIQEPVMTNSGKLNILIK